MAVALHTIAAPDKMPLSPVLTRAPLVDRTSLLVTPVWSAWLQALWGRSGGALAWDNTTLGDGVQSVGEAIDAIHEDIEALYLRVTSLDTDVAALTGRLETVETGLATLDAVPTTRQVLAGTGLSGGGALSADVTLDNAGVLSLTGTANRVTVSASTGAVTLSGPQDLDSGATPTFARVLGTQNLAAPSLYATGNDTTGVSGSACRLAVASGTGYVQAYDFTTPGALPLILFAQTLTMQNASGNPLVVDAVGNTSLRGNLGANGTTPARPTVTGARAGNAALASLLTGLAAIGLVTDSTTP